MKIRELGFLACRVLSIYCVITCIGGIASSFNASSVADELTTGHLTSSHNTNLPAFWITVVVSALLYGIAAVILWYRADGISLKLARSNEETAAEPISSRAAWALGMRFIGMFILIFGWISAATAVPMLLIFYYHPTPDLGFVWNYVPRVIGAAVQLAIGYRLAFGASLQAPQVAAPQ